MYVHNQQQNAANGQGSPKPVPKPPVKPDDKPKPTPTTAPPADCTAFAPVYDITNMPVSGGGGQIDTTQVRDGVTYQLHVRVCNGVFQSMWIPTLSGADMAKRAYDEAVALTPEPTVAMAPPPDKLIVNLETWFGVNPTPPVSATASLPGISATVVLRPVKLVFNPGNGSPITCPLWGSADRPTSGCVWTPRLPSTPATTGAGYAFHGSVTITWTATWTATDGTGGALDPIDRTTNLDLAVREIQTIGGG